MRKSLILLGWLILLTFLGCQKQEVETLDTPSNEVAFRLPFSEDDFTTAMKSTAVERLAHYDSMAIKLGESTSLQRWGRVDLNSLMRYETKEGHPLFLAPMRHVRDSSLLHYLVGYWDEEAHFYFLHPERYISSTTLSGTVLTEVFSHFVAEELPLLGYRYELPECFVQVPCSGIEIMCIKEIDCDYGSGSGGFPGGPGGFPTGGSEEGGSTGDSNSPPSTSPPEDDVEVEIDRLEEKMLRFLAVDLINTLNLEHNADEVAATLDVECLSLTNQFDCAYQSFANSVVNSVQLNSQQRDWLINMPSALGDAANLILGNPDHLEEVSKALAIVTDLQTNGDFYSPEYINTVVAYEDGNPVIINVLYTIECVNIRLENPGWSDFRVSSTAMFNIILETLHIGLDAIGMIPVAGEVADLTNGVLYTIEGDGINATLSFAATIPFAGWFATGAKYAHRKIIGTSGWTITLKYIVEPTGNILFGRSGQLKTVLKPPANHQAHHIIPWQHRSNPVVQAAAKADFHMNDFPNGIAVHVSRHNGSHPSYSAYVQQQLLAIEAIWGSNLTPQIARQELTTLLLNLRSKIVNNPTTPINNLF